MIPKIICRLALFALVLLLLTSVVSAVATANTIPGSHAGRLTQVINANALKPAACSSLSLTTIVVCPATGNCNGTNGNDLILGNATAEDINGKNGSDCILGGGGGNDTITGGNGTNVCIGHVGDTYSRCQTIINQ